MTIGECTQPDDSNIFQPCPELHAIEIDDSSAQFSPGRVVALRSILDIFVGVAKLDATCRQLQRDVVVLSDPTIFCEWKTMENLIRKYP